MLIIITTFQGVPKNGLFEEPKGRGKTGGQGNHHIITTLSSPISTLPATPYPQHLHLTQHNVHTSCRHGQAEKEKRDKETAAMK